MRKQEFKHDMALRSSTKKTAYSRISKPKVSPGGFSSYSNTLIRKQQAAEDAIIDNQYASGDITSEYYLSKLNDRLARTTLTPLQQVTLREKVNDVTVKAQDAKVASDYSAGKLTTAQMRDYETAKLNNMSAADSAAYSIQQKKVQDLTDKAQKEARSAFRISENLRISKLPEDTSENLNEKARLYDTLANQARIDGDSQQADTLETSKNNYLASAKRASINDLITNTRQSVSSTLPGGLGVPSAEGGNAYLKTLTGQDLPGYSSANPGASVGNTTGVPGGGGSTSSGGAVVQTYSGVGQSSQITNALKALDASQKSYERTQSQIADKTNLLSTYDNAISQASGDQKTTLTIARNNIVSELATLNNSLSVTESSINDKIQSINEAQAKVAFGNFKKQTSAEVKALDLAEKKLESDLKAGNIDKSKYLFEMANLSGSRIQLKTDEANGYREFGEDQIADEKDAELNDLTTTRAATVYQTLVDGVSKIQDPKQQDKFIQDSIGKIGNSYELIRVDKDGTLNNISGKGLKRGDVSLVDVSDEKYNGTFNTSYIKDGRVFAKVNYPTQLDPLTGQTITVRDPSKIKGNQPYFIGSDGQAKQVRFVNQSKPGQTPIYVPVAKTEFDKQANKYQPAIQGSTLVYTLKPQASAPFKVPGAISDTANALGKAGVGIGGLPGVNPLDIAGKAKDVVGNIFNGIFGGNKNQGKQATNPNGFNIDNIVNAAKNFQVVPTANAAELRRKGSNPSAVNGVPDETVKYLTAALKEQGIYSPQTLAYALGTIQHETGGTFQPVNEGYYLDKGQEPGTSGKQIALKNGYSGGENYYGRGYIQLTHDYNYRDIGKKLGIDLVNNPDLANDPSIASRILALFMKERGTADKIKAGDLIGARTTINNDNKGNYIAGLANNFMKTINTLPKVNAQVSKPKVENSIPRSTVERIIQGTQPGAKTIQLSTTAPSSSATLRSQGNASMPTFTKPASVNIGASQSGLTQLRSTSTSKSQPNIFQNISSGIGNAANNAVKAITSVFNPPRIISPLPQQPKIQPSPIQNVVKTVQSVASNVGNWLNQFNPFKKKK